MHTDLLATYTFQHIFIIIVSETAPGSWAVLLQLAVLA